MTWFKFITNQIFDFNTSSFSFFFPNSPIYPSSYSFKLISSLVTNCYCMHLCIDMWFLNIYFSIFVILSVYIFSQTIYWNLDNQFLCSSPEKNIFPASSFLKFFLCRVRGLLEFTMLLECTFLPSMFSSHLGKHIQMYF